jgi:hypothetical protein
MKGTIKRITMKESHTDAKQIDHTSTFITTS